MTDKVFLNRDRTKVVPPGSVESKWQISREEAAKLGLLDSAEKPTQTRRAPAHADKVGPTAPKQKRRTTRKK